MERLEGDSGGRSGGLPRGWPLSELFSARTAELHFRLLKKRTPICPCLKPSCASDCARPDGISSHFEHRTPVVGSVASKYPPAKPGALGCEPLKAAAGSLTRPRKTTGDNEVLTCRGPLLNLPAHFPCYKLWEFVTFLEAQRPHAASPGAILCEKAHHCEFPANTAVTVKLLLPPRQSRGVSQRTRSTMPPW